MSPLAISFEDVMRAHRRIVGIAHRTPVLTSATANQSAGAQLFFKCENFQRSGAFKFRGAYNAMAQLTPEQRTRGVIAYSSGNHAQAIALSAQLLGVKSVIVMPSDGLKSRGRPHAAMVARGCCTTALLRIVRHWVAAWQRNKDTH